MPTNPWLVLAGFITAYDIWLIRTGRVSLSSTYKNAAHDHPVLVTAGTAYLLAHLYGFLPNQTDALRGFGVLNRGSRVRHHSSAQPD